ncbi:MAG: DUF4011 domain-containing protein [Lachnospiraceae bacterium]|nr:DUF4011 domain-containing protein [Lachnospiraceae bacterium]
MAGSLDKDTLKTEYGERDGRIAGGARSAENVFSDSSYYQDIEQLADLDISHFGNIEKKADFEDFQDLEEEMDDPDGLERLEAKIILEGLRVLQEDYLPGKREEEPYDETSEEESEKEEDYSEKDPAFLESESCQEKEQNIQSEETEPELLPSPLEQYRWDPSTLLIDVSMCEEMNFVMQLGGVLLVRDIALKNEGDGELRDIRVEITSDDEIIFPSEEIAPALLAGEEWHIVQPDIRVNTSYLAFLRERTECVLRFTVSGKNRFSKLVSKSIEKTVVVMAYDQWKGNDFHTNLLPAFIMPSQPFISELVVEAADILGRETGNPVLDSYLSDDRNRIRQMASSAYEAIRRRRISEIPYAANKSDILKRIRLAEKIRKQGRAASYDITFVYLSCLEAMGLNPVMYLRHENAYAGVWLVDKTFDKSVVTDLSEAAGRVDAGEILLIDCGSMLLGRECPFTEAMDLAMNSLFLPDEFVAMIDVLRSRREGVKPLPLRIHADSAASSDRTQKSEAPEIADGKNRKERKKRESEETLTESRTLASIRQNLEKWKKDLYDPDKPNQLVDMKIGGESGEKTGSETEGDALILPLLAAYVNDFVDMLSDVMYFGVAPKPEDFETPVEVTPENTGQVDEIRDILRTDFRRKKVHTIYGWKETAYRVRRLIDEAESNLANHGKSVLYLAAGVLKWTEITTGAVRHAPLVLLPVEVRTGDDKGRPFRLSESQPQFNFALLDKMEKEYFLNVPDLLPLPRDYRGVDVRRVCTLFREAAAGREGWDVFETAFLGIFDLPGYLQSRSFIDTDQAESHHILRGLSEGMRKTEIDKAAVRAEDVYLPLGADRFQEYAVKASVRGLSFAISGAPGTGKTRTAVNIIANAIARKKTVLFTCETDEAIRDALAQMEKIGLAPFCLYGQQGNVRMRDLLPHMKEALQAGKSHGDIPYEKALAEVTEIGQALDGYSETVNSRHVCGYSLRELLDIYEKYREYPKFDMGIIDADSVTSVILKQRRDLMRDLLAIGKSAGHPKDNPLSCVRRTFYSDALCEEAFEAAQDGNSLLEKFRDTLGRFVDLLELNPPVSEESIYQMVLIAQFVSELRDVPSFLLMKNDARPVLRQLREYISGADAFAKRDLAMGGKWNPGFLHADMDAFLAAYDEAKAKMFFRDRAIKEFRTDLEQYAYFSFEDREIPELLAEVKKYQRESEQQAERWENLTEECRTLLKEYNSYEAADELTERVEAYRQLCDQLPTIMRYAYNVDIRKASTDLADALPGLYDEVKKEWEKLVEILDIDTEGYREDPIGKLDGVYSAILEDTENLPNWIRFNDLVLRAESNGLRGLVDRYLDGAEPDEIMGSFYRGMYFALIKSITDKNPAAGRFEAGAFNELIAHFRDADENLTRLAALRLQNLAAESIPKMKESPKIAVELMALKRAISSFGRGMTVGNIFEQMPNAITRLCPCIMMSPAACAEYMTDKWPIFDLVVIDEASCMPSYSAAGVIPKGRELILAGDICQNHVPGSILELCLSAGLPEIKLGMHYRSMDERLFTFSNREFYNGSIITFPASDGEGGRISYIGVPDGAYDEERHLNEAEARAVMNEIMRLYAENAEKKRSVGVVAFGHRQKLRIAELLDEACAGDKEFAEWARTPKERLLVTDVFGAQGHVRDDVILSVTMAGNDECADVSHMLDENGWKYLNIAATRAREHMLVVSSITADEIRANANRSRGAATLAGFLDYASGNRGEAIDGIPIQRQKKAGVLREIRKILDDAGYVTKAMAGESGFRVDIAVALPEKRDRYILGILLDSENYSGIGAARDRDILMPSELLRRGWPIMNIWCMEWWNRRDEVARRVLGAADYMREQIFG